MVWLANPERYGQMQYRYCGKSGLRLPALSLGLWHNFGHVNALLRKKRFTPARVIARFMAQFRSR